MKKSLSLIIAICIAAISFSQETSMPIDEETGKVTYTAVVDEEGDASQLYQNALAWFDEFYPNARGVIKQKDAEKHTISGKGKFRMMIENEKGVPEKAGFILYDIDLMTRDGRYKYVITNIELDYVTPFGVEKWMTSTEDEEVMLMNQKKLDAVESYFEELIKSLEAGMETEEEGVEDDW